MALRRWLGVCILAGAVALTASGLYAQDHGKPAEKDKAKEKAPESAKAPDKAPAGDKAAPKAMTPDKSAEKPVPGGDKKGGHGGDEAMAAMMKAGAPGENHELLKGMVGTWKATSKMWMAPGTEPMPGDAISENTLVLGGRFVHTVYKDKNAEHPFEGVGLTGYDNFKKKFSSTWADSMATSVGTSYGTYDAATKTFAYVGEYDDSETGKPVKYRMTVKINSNDQHTMEMFQPGPDGKEFKGLEVAYTRSK